MEAEHFFSKRDADGLQWTCLPFFGRTLSAMTVMPADREMNGKDVPQLTYRFTTTNNVQRLQVVVKSTLDFLNRGGHRFRVTLDGGEPVEVNFNQNLNERPENIYRVYYPTVASRVVAAEVPLKAEAGEHQLTIEPLDPAIVFEKVVVDCGGFQKSYLFGRESPRKYSQE
jgi:hypothetical protein